MKNYVITIAREYGSGGRSIGKMLAETLGISYYDREILRLASDDSGISEQLFAKMDESAKSTSLFRIAKDAYTGEVIPPDREDFVSNENLFRYQAKVIRQLASTESCVIIGRAADYILKDFDNVLRLYIHAPFEVCVKTVMDMYAYDEETAKKTIRKIDKRRAEFYRYFTGSDWREADHYDLCLDSHALGWEKCVRLVKAYLEIRFD